MQSWRSGSMRALRMSPTPDGLDDMLSLARTNPPGFLPAGDEVGRGHGEIGDGRNGLAWRVNRPIPDVTGDSHGPSRRGLSLASAGLMGFPIMCGRFTLRTPAAELARLFTDLHCPDLVGTGRGCSGHGTITPRRRVCWRCGWPRMVPARQATAASSSRCLRPSHNRSLPTGISREQRHSDSPPSTDPLPCFTTPPRPPPRTPLWPTRCNDCSTATRWPNPAPIRKHCRKSGASPPTLLRPRRTNQRTRPGEPALRVLADVPGRLAGDVPLTDDDELAMRSPTVHFGVFETARHRGREFG